MVLADNIQDDTEFRGTDELIDAHFDFVIEDITSDTASKIFDTIISGLMVRNMPLPFGGWSVVGKDNIYVAAIKEKMQSIDKATKDTLFATDAAKAWDDGYVHGLKFALGVLGYEEVPDEH